MQERNARELNEPWNVTRWEKEMVWKKPTMNEEKRKYE